MAFHLRKVSCWTTLSSACRIILEFFREMQTDTKCNFLTLNFSVFCLVLCVAVNFSSCYHCKPNTMYMLSLVPKKYRIWIKNIGFEAFHGEVSIYFVCGNTMCVSTCQVEFVLRELSFFLLLPWSRCSVDFWMKKEMNGKLECLRVCSLVSVCLVILKAVDTIGIY